MWGGIKDDTSVLGLRNRREGRHAVTQDKEAWRRNRLGRHMTVYQINECRYQD